MNYSLMSSNCISHYIYYDYNPTLNFSLIEYTNPFIAAWFPEDEQYVRLCENYDYYTSLEPHFGEATTCLSWKRDTGKARHINSSKWGNYLVMFLGDIEIHWIHDQNTKLLLTKFNERLKLCKERERVFLWYEPVLNNIHTEEERSILINRFCAIPHKTIYLTKFQNEERQDKNTIIRYVPQWEGKSQHDRNAYFFLNWDNEHLARKVFKECIDKFITDNK